MSLPLVILGTGLAGYNLAREFRKLDKETPLVIISRDHAGFYSKPMLSNALASNKTAATLVMKTSDKMAAELNATVHSHAEVTQLSTQNQTLVLSNGTVLAYRDLVLALGADPIRLPLTGSGAQEVLSVNDLDDYACFASELENVQRVAILGAGLIGCEFANDLLARHITPTVIDLADRPLSRLLPLEASQHLQSRMEAAGVAFRLGASVSQVNRIDSGYALELSDGSTLHADRVLSAIGLQPRTQLALQAGLAVKRGVVTDRWLATSAAHVHALGDCAEVAGHWLPFVMPIMQQARALAATLAGTRTPVAYPAMPVTVKTPACPTVVCPPLPGAVGVWAVERTEDACIARYQNAQRQLLGFALQGSATAQRQALVATLPAWLSG